MDRSNAPRLSPSSRPRRGAGKKPPTRNGIGRSAERLLAGLFARGPAHPIEPKRPAGASIIPCPTAADILIAADLAIRRGDGALVITESGRAHLLRLELARSSAPIDPFLGQHVGLARTEVETDDGRVSLAVDAAESPLAWLARRKGRDGRALIEPLQLLAGERLRSDFTRGQLMPRITSNWHSPVAQDGRNIGGGGTFTEGIIAARQRVRRALAALGPDLADLLVDVCCFLKGLEDVERQRNWPPRSAKVVLQLGLDRLCRHYGFATEARGAARAAMRAWLAADVSRGGGEPRIPLRPRLRRFNG